VKYGARFSAEAYIEDAIEFHDAFFAPLEALPCV
jgi:hypothetical protein